MNRIEHNSLEYLANKILGIMMPLIMLGASSIVFHDKFFIVVGVLFGAILGIVMLPLFLGAVSGSVASAVIKPEKSMAGQVAKILAGALIGFGMSSAIGRYNQVEAWEYLFLLSLFCGLIGLIIAKAVYRIFERRAEPAIETKLSRYLGDKEQK